jgi:aerobic carbon-monoxide dehydrogenase medium subunit
MIPGVTLSRPRSHNELAQVLAEVGDTGPSLYFGGTDLVPRLLTGEVRTARLVDGKGVEGADRIGGHGDGLWIGMAATLEEVRRHPEVVARAPGLAEAIPRVAHVRVRLAGTLVGNVCAARERSDVVGLMVALGARLHLRSRHGGRAVDVEDFVQGERATSLAVGEFAAGIEIPAVAAQGRLHSARVGRHHGPLANVAVLAAPDTVRIAVGGVVTRPLRPRDLEAEAAAGRVPEPADVHASLHGLLDGTPAGLAADPAAVRLAGVLLHRTLRADLA